MPSTAQSFDESSRASGEKETESGPVAQVSPGAVDGSTLIGNLPAATGVPTRWLVEPTIVAAPRNTQRLAYHGHGKGHAPSRRSARTVQCQRNRGPTWRRSEDPAERVPVDALRGRRVVVERVVADAHAEKLAAKPASVGRAPLLARLAAVLSRVKYVHAPTLDRSPSRSIRTVPSRRDRRKLRLLDELYGRTVWKRPKCVVPSRQPRSRRSFRLRTRSSNSTRKTSRSNRLRRSGRRRSTPCYRLLLSPG